MIKCHLSVNSWIDLLQVLVGHEETVMCCAIASDENIIVSGAKDSQIIVWSTSTGDALFSLKTESTVIALAINNDTTVILSGYIDNLLKKKLIWIFIKFK